MLEFILALVSLGNVAPPRLGPPTYWDGLNFEGQTWSEMAERLPKDDWYGRASCHLNAMGYYNQATGVAIDNLYLILTRFSRR